MGFDFFSFPFREIGLFLRWLSESGSAGNAAAVFLYGAVCLLPVIWLLFRIFRLRRGFRPADLWLPLISASLFLVLYFMINPGCLPEKMMLMSGTDLCVCLWSEIILCLVMGILRTIRNGSEENLLRYLQAGIIVLGVCLVLFVPAGIYTQLLPEIEELKEMNYDPAASVAASFGLGDPLAPSIGFLWFKYLMDCIPTLAVLPVLRAGYKLTESFCQDKFGAETVAASEHLCGICGLVLPVMAAEPFAMNLFQLVSGGLRSLHYQLQFPVIEIVLVICVFLLAKFFASAKLLKDENGMII